MNGQSDSRQKYKQAERRVETDEEKTHVGRLKDKLMKCGQTPQRHTLRLCRLHPDVSVVISSHLIVYSICYSVKEGFFFVFFSAKQHEVTASALHSFP